MCIMDSVSLRMHLFYLCPTLVNLCSCLKITFMSVLYWLGPTELTRMVCVAVGLELPIDTYWAWLCVDAEENDSHTVCLQPQFSRGWGPRELLPHLTGEAWASLAQASCRSLKPRRAQSRDRCAMPTWCPRDGISQPFAPASGEVLFAPFPLCFRCLRSYGVNTLFRTEHPLLILKPCEPLPLSFQQCGSMRGF